MSMGASHEAKDEGILEPGWIKPSFLQGGCRAGGELGGVWLSSGVTSQETKQSENPASNTEPSPREEFLFYREKSKASSLL